MSIDYAKSGRIALNSVIDLYQIGKKTRVTFDFIQNSISPIEAESVGAKELMNDYLEWLPKHFETHNCNLALLKKLEINISVDFTTAKQPHRMPGVLEFQVFGKVTWKTNKEGTQVLEISNLELMKESFMLERIPELKKTTR